MKRITGILVCTLAAGLAWAQSPQILDNVRTQMNTVQKNNTAASNEALGGKPAVKSSSAKPAAPVKSIAAKNSAVTPTPKTVAVKSVAVTPKASVVAAKSVTPSAKPTAVKTAAVKTVAVKSVAVRPAPSAVPAKAVSSAVKSSVVASSHSSKSAEPFKEKKIGVKQVAAKKPAKPSAEKKKAVAAAPAKSPDPAASSADGALPYEEAKSGGDDDAVKEAQEKKWSMSGKRDPFISPVVSHAGGSGCSTGKKCLEIGAINLRGVVHSDAGFIAVVTNNLNKAYFLRENDPVFDGYVVKITGDSIIFKATMQDRLGKTFTREVTKKITTPAV